MTNLSILIIFPLLTTLAVLFCRNVTQIKWTALAGSLIQLVLASLLMVSYYAERGTGNTSQMLFEQRYSWYSALNIEYYIGVDGISVIMIMLTAFVVSCGILISWKIETLTKEFFFLLLLLSVGAYGFFISLDLFTMFFFLELAVIPKYLLIAIWGSGKKEYSANKLALMLMGGSALVLVGILGMYYNAGNTFDILKISQVHIPMEMQKIL